MATTGRVDLRDTFVAYHWVRGTQSLEARQVKGVTLPAASNNQADRDRNTWYEDVNRFFMGVGMTRSSEDHSLYFSNYLVILLYVDDLLLFAKDMQSIDTMKKKLSTSYQMTDLGPIRQFLGLQISRNCALHQIELHQLPYIRTLLTRFQMSDCKGISTPIEPNCYLPPCADDTDISNRSEYHSKIGSTM